VVGGRWSVVGGRWSVVGECMESELLLGLFLDFIKKNIYKVTIIIIFEER